MLRCSTTDISRRDLLSATALSAFGLAGLPAVARESVAASGKAKSVIVLYLHGGAPTQDMFDLKPDAPAEIRGEFKPIETDVSGIRICEHLPLTARWMRRCALVRTVHHFAGCHNTLAGFTGNEQPVDINDPVPKDSFPPGMGSVVEYLKPPENDLPHYLAVPNYLGWGWNVRRPGPQGGFLGKRYDALCSECTPVSDPNPGPDRFPMWLGTPQLEGTMLGPGITVDRLTARKSLLERIDDGQRPAELPAAVSYDRARGRAFSLLTSSKLKSAFDLSAEEPALREKYGKHLFGSSALIARRLVEAGVRFVDVYWDGYTYKAPTKLDPYWDTHSKNFIQLKGVNLPNLDQTYDALLSDLESHGLLDETLVLMMSDFGRTPRVNANAGRDHWTSCYTVVFAGAGIRGGTVCGVSDGQAAYVKDRPVRPADVCATVYAALGISPETLIRDRSGRPVTIANGGQAISEILS